MKKKREWVEWRILENGKPLYLAVTTKKEALAKLKACRNFGGCMDEPRTYELIKVKVREV